MVNSTDKPLTVISQSTTVEIYMVNSTMMDENNLSIIYNSRNLYGQFDAMYITIVPSIYNSRNLYGQFD